MTAARFKNDAEIAQYARQLNTPLTFCARKPTFLKTASHHYKIVRIGEPQPTYKLDSPELAQSYWRDVIAVAPWFDAEKEHLIALFLNTRFAIKGFSLVSVGSCNESIAHPREVFRVAIATSAYAVIIMHNHPSGDPSPSQSDHGLTRRLREAGELLQINVLDHIIVGEPAEGRKAYYSFKEMGVL